MIFFNLGAGKNSKDPQEQSNLFSPSEVNFRTLKTY